MTVTVLEGGKLDDEEVAKAVFTEDGCDELIIELPDAGAEDEEVDSEDNVTVESWVVEDTDEDDDGVDETGLELLTSTVVLAAGPEEVSTEVVLYTVELSGCEPSLDDVLLAVLAVEDCGVIAKNGSNEDWLVLDAADDAVFVQPKPLSDGDWLDGLLAVAAAEVEALALNGSEDSEVEFTRGQLDCTVDEVTVV